MYAGGTGFVAERFRCSSQKNEGVFVTPLNTLVPDTSLESHA